MINGELTGKDEAAGRQHSAPEEIAMEIRNGRGVRFELGAYELDVDVGRTRAFCDRDAGIACACDGCRNYQKAAAAFPAAVRDFLESLGLAPEKPAEVYVNCAEAEGMRLSYGGFYHLCGVIRRGEGVVRLAEGYRVWFRSECDLIADDFPRPAVQMEIDFHVPWVLDEENTY